MSSYNCVINFHAPAGVYYSGCYVTGTAQFTLNKPKKFKGIFIELKGISKVAWSESHGTGASRRVLNYASRIEYFVITSPLINANEGENTISLGDGEHGFDFSFQLPENIPSSFEGLHGSVRYTAKIIMDQPWKVNKHFKKAFTVLSNVDLNLNPIYAMPVIHKLEKTNFSLFGKSGLVEVEVFMPGIGFVPGQSIPIRLNVKNESKSSIDEFIAHLTQVATYQGEPVGPGLTYGSGGICAIKNKIIQVQTNDQVKKNTTKDIDLSLEIPSTAPSSAINSNINISYYIKVIAQVSGMHRNLEGKFPVTIGTVPFYLHLYNQAGVSSFSQPVQYPYCSQPEFIPTAPDSDDEVPSRPPPSYQETMQIGEGLNNDDDDDEPFTTYDKDYRPKYPVYKAAK